MKTSVKVCWILLGSVLLCWSSTELVYSQQSTGQLFEKALYAEEVKGDLQEALELYQQVLNENPDNRTLGAKALLHTGICYEKMGSQQARQAYQDVINKYAEQSEEAELARDRISRLEAHLADLNRKAEQHIRQGNELFKRWEYEDAVREYENAIKLNPNTLLAMNAQYCIGQSWYRAGKYDEAFATLTNLIEENPNSTIAPVTELMLAQVSYAMENDENTALSVYDADEKVFVDPESGITYTKIRTFTGKNDWINYATGGFNISQDGRFMVLENKVVPIDGSDPFYLPKTNAMRAIYSPDMNNVAYIADSAIWVAPVSAETGRVSGQPKELIKGNFRYDGCVSWTPDGRKLVFHRNDNENYGDIWSISISDSKLEPIITSPKFETSPHVSPDGKYIVYRKDGDTWIASINGEDPELIFEQGGLPFWSKDNRWICYFDWENSHLYSMEDHKNYKMAFLEKVGTFASFSPDGDKMWFYKPSSDDKWGMRIVSASGGPSFTHPSNCTVYGSQWSPDSKSILAQSENDQGEVTFKIVPIAGTNPINVTIYANTEGAPFPFEASPDLTKLAFSVNRDDRKEDLYVIPFSLSEGRTTGPERMVFEGWSGGAYNVNVAWSPDGTKLAVIHEGDIWVCPTEEGEPVRITDTPETERWVNWSPDGRMIAYVGLSGQTLTGHAIQATGGNPITLPLNRYTTGNWTPDSKGLALISKDELKIVSLNGDTENHFARLSDLELDDTSAPRYSPDGKQLAFIGYYEGNDKSVICVHTIESGQTIKIADENVDDFKYELRWSPDGKWISYLTEEGIKVRPEGALWEADFNEVIEKLTSQ